MKRTLISSGGPLESVFGNSRAVRVGPFVYVSGTGAIDSHGKVVGVGDSYAQCSYTLKKIAQALSEAGPSWNM